MKRMQKHESAAHGGGITANRSSFHPEFSVRTTTPRVLAEPPSPSALRRDARLNPNCIACGKHNPKGLQLEFQNGPSGVDAIWTPTGEWESFQGTVHGGIISTVLDEAMSKAVIVGNWEALTVDLRVRFLGRVTPGERLSVRGWVIEKHGRKIRTEATLKTNAGAERAHTWATFLVPRS